MMVLGGLVARAVALVSLCLGVQGAGVQNLDFEAAAGQGGVPPGWFVPPVCGQAGWDAKVSEGGAGPGGHCASLERHIAGAEADGGFGNLMQSVDAAPYVGKRIVVTAKMRLGPHATGRAQFWVRVDRPEAKRGFFDNCADRPVTEESWKTVAISGDVDDEATALNFGMMVVGGNGPALLDDVTIEVRDKRAVKVDSPRELTSRGLANLVALTRAIGYVRHFHPSDEAVGVDWDRFTVESVGLVEPVASAGELVQSLGRVFAPVAPSAAFSAEAFAGEFDAASMLRAENKPTHTVAWRHRGFGAAEPDRNAIYVSARVETAVGGPAEQGVASIGECVTRRCDLPGDEHVWMRVPIALYKDARGTLPRVGTGYAPRADAPELSGEDRATRLAAVILAWNVLQHFFPYFDDTADNWEGALPEALRAAATDAGEIAFARTLERMVTHLHDGHGNVMMRSPAAYFALPLLVTFIKDEPVVLNAVDNAVPRGVLPGDVLVSIGGTPVADIVADARAHEPAATEGFFRHRASMRLVRRENADPVEVVLRGPDGAAKRAMLKPVAPDRLPAERSGAIVREPKLGVWYVDLDRATDNDLKDALPQLVKAKGVVFDMRGYPNGFSMGLVLGHLTDERVQCARWEIPLANRPDQLGMAWEHSRWDLPPIRPRIKGKVAFITDGRAISAAETFMGIVEQYKLGAIVGEPTAGTNGNVNTIHLPGGYSIVFTGMKVLKHDGSRHHGIGILPTVEVGRTVAGVAAGKDEMLEKAIEVVGGP